MTTLVTGGFGCIGSWVARALLAEGERPVVFDLGDDPWRLRMIVGDDVAERVTLVRGEIGDRAAVARAVQEHDVQRIIHLAAWQVPLHDVLLHRRSTTCSGSSTLRPGRYRSAARTRPRGR